ncbi:MAG TPA: D-aminoacylase [Candidatus Limnocylindrales bacterium]
MPFDLVLRGGLLVDGTGAPGRIADVGIESGRVTAIGDLSVAPVGDVPSVIDARGHVVAPGFVDPHGHSDGSLFLDGALISHLAQGYTTQLSGNCGYTFAPLTPAARAMLAADLEALGLDPDWTTFAGFLDGVETQALGPNVVFLVGHGTVRAAVLGAAGRAPGPSELAAMVAYVDEALDAGAVGVSSGLIYAPGVHARPDEVASLVAAAVRRGALYATHMRNESAGVLAAIDEAIETARAARDMAGRPPRLQVSHLKAGAKAVWGMADALVARIDAARRDGLDVAADQYPYTAAATTLATVLPPSILALPVDDAVAALRDPGARSTIRTQQATGVTGWENVTADPGWAGIVIARSDSHPDWAGRSLAELADAEGRDPADLAFDILADDRLSADIVIHCMAEPDLETILRVPWIAVCTDAEGRRPEHPILGAGVPHPRTYGSTARVLGRYTRDRGVIDLETAVAKLSGVPAARIGLRDRGVLREGAFADVVVFDPDTVADHATYERPAVHPAGIRDVIVNGRPAIRDGRETGDRPGRLLRHGA